MMKKLIPPSAALLGVLFAVVAWFYLNQVWCGIRGYTPPCAPIGTTTVPVVFAFTAAGAIVCIVAAALSMRRRLWGIIAVIALIANIAAFSTWGYWIRNEMLLPYDQFCERVGMPQIRIVQQDKR